MPVPTQHLSGKAPRPRGSEWPWCPRHRDSATPWRKGVAAGQPGTLRDTKGTSEAQLFPEGGEGHAHSDDSTGKARDTTELDSGMEGWKVCRPHVGGNLKHSTA